MANRILNAVSSCEIVHGNEVIRCTVSIGALPINSHDIAWRNNPVQYADDALYQAKSRGRNGVAMAAWPLSSATAS